MIRSLVISLILATSAAAGPYPAYTTGGVAPAQVNAWADALVNYSPAPGVVAMDSFGGGPHNVPAKGLGAADGTTVSLGDLDAIQIGSAIPVGQITLSFTQPIFNGPGADLAVFENASTFFTAPVIFGELAFVEVSSNGVDYARFPAVSLNTEADLDAPFGRDFAGVNTTNIHNLAGVHPTRTGTPFDLAELTSAAAVVSGAVNLSGIRFVRLVDIPGNGAFTDSLGNPVLDPWLSVESGGFDLDAVGAINVVPEPTALVLALIAACGLRAVAASLCFQRGAQRTRTAKSQIRYCAAAIVRKVAPMIEFRNVA